MFKIISKEIKWAGSTLKLETGKVARQADGAVMVTYGNTMVLCTVVADKKPKEGIDFLPLTVHYKEMFFAAGRIPGGFYKREGKASEKEVLVSRLIDRPIRPLFFSHYYHETQITCTVLSFDNIHDSDVIAIIGAAAALAISNIPFNGPIAAAKVGYSNGKYILNPKLGAELAESELELVVAGTADSVLMVESEAKMLSEEIMLGAVKFGHQHMQPVLDMINEFAAEAGNKKFAITTPDYTQLDLELKNLVEGDLRKAYQETEKQIRNSKVEETKKRAAQSLSEKAYSDLDISYAFKHLQQNIVRRQIIDLGKRIDGRTAVDIRQIENEVSFLPRTHGSALFTRGETQVVAVTTLGAGTDEQLIDALEGESKQHFMLHYNFPPYSVGEAYPARAPGRREIGHGKLAWRALHAVLPQKKDFPYTLRIVAEVTESNGSSSMATVCGGSLSLMDAGVPIHAPVAGIAMGLILEQDKFVVLSDIMGDEDYLGDMDFKVAGTTTGITALQMDIKVRGITYDIMETALAQAQEGRIHILDKMKEALGIHRTSVNEFAPSIITIKVNKDKIRELIGPGGKVIKSICEETKAKIDIDDNGTVTIASMGLEQGLKAQKRIEDIAMDPEVNQIFKGTVVKLMEFGAFVNYMSNKDGFLHISEIMNDKVADINDVLKEGDQVWVKLLGFDARGKVKLSMKEVNQETGENLGDSERPASSNHDNNDKRYKGNKGNSRPSTGGNKNYSGNSNSNGNRGNRNDRGDRNNAEPRANDKRKYFT